MTPVSRGFLRDSVVYTDLTYKERYSLCYHRSIVITHSDISYIYSIAVHDLWMNSSLYYLPSSHRDDSSNTGLGSTASNSISIVSSPSLRPKKRMCPLAFPIFFGE